MNKLTTKQYREIKHALGGEIKRDSYRNYFNTVIDSESWDELVKIGFAIKTTRNSQRGGVYYFVTEKAIDELI